MNSEVLTTPAASWSSSYGAAPRLPSRIEAPRPQLLSKQGLPSAQNSCFQKVTSLLGGGATGCVLGSLPTATSSKVGDLNNTKWHTCELIS